MPVLKGFHIFLDAYGSIRLNTIKNRKPLIFHGTPRTPANAGAKGYGKKGVGCLQTKLTKHDILLNLTQSEEEAKKVLDK